MRRTDLSRKIGRVVTTIEQGVLVGESFDMKSIVSIVKNELDLRPSKAIETANNTIVNFKDSEFEGTLKKTDIYAYDSEAKNLGVKDIKNICGMVQVKYSGDRVELSLIVESEYIDNQGKKHKAFPNLKNVDILLTNDKKDDISIDDEVKEAPNSTAQEDIVVNDTGDKQQEESLDVNDDVEKTYKDYIGEVVSNLFGKRFYGSAPSEELKNIIIDKIHNIYVVNYLQQLYTNDSIKDDSGEGIQVIKRILDTL